MRIVFAGTPDVAVPALTALHTTGAYDVVGVLTRNDAPVGRKKVLTPSPVAAAAAQMGLRVNKADRPDAETVAWVSQLRPDIGVVVAYGGLLREPLLQTPRLGWVNLHFSELPRWRGAAPVQRALIAGETTLGLDVFRLVAELDAGPLVSRAQHTVAPGSTAGEVLATLAAEGADLLGTALQVLAADPEYGVAQQGEISYAHKLTRADGKLDCTKTTAEVFARWAGVTPEPGAYLLLNGQSVKVVRLAQPDLSATVPPNIAAGTAVLVGKKAYLGCADGVLELQTVQPAGKAQMSAADWLRGRGTEAVFDG